MASVIVLGFGAYSWDGFHVVPVPRWSFLQSLFHFCPCISFRQEQFWVGVPIPPLGVLSDYWRWSLQVPYPHCWAFLLRSTIVSPGCLPHPSPLGISKGSPTPYCLSSSIFPFIPLALWVSHLSSLIPDYPPIHIPVPSPTQVPPSLCLLRLFCYHF